MVNVSLPQDPSARIASGHGLRRREYRRSPKAAEILAAAIAVPTSPVRATQDLASTPSLPPWAQVGITREAPPSKETEGTQEPHECSTNPSIVPRLHVHAFNPRASAPDGLGGLPCLLVKPALDRYAQTSGNAEGTREPQESCSPGSS
jgi:hypothetical protein